MIRNRWQGRASCRGVDPEVFFPVGDDWAVAPGPAPVPWASRADRAKAVCDRCPVRAQCLADALERTDIWAILGGLDPVERAALIRRPAA
jgi:WhiB family redox-sensing transcriptional regulator